MNFEKTKIRSKLSFEILRAILLAAQYIGDLGGILSFQPSDELIKQVFNFKYYKKHRKEQLNVNLHKDEEIIRRCREENITFSSNYFVFFLFS